MAGRLWTEEEVQQLREWYSGSDIFAREMAARLGRPLRSVYNKAKALGLRRTKEMLSLAGKIGAGHEKARAHRFERGNLPANKGKKMSSELYAKCAPTMFKKGNIPKKHRDVGSERISKDGYIEVKVAEPDKWRFKHRIIWEEANGPIENGYIIQFKDGNPKNLKLENLYLISRRRQLLEQNSLMARYPKEIRDIIHLRGAVKRQMTLFNKHKENNDEQ